MAKMCQQGQNTVTHELEILTENMKQAKRRSWFTVLNNVDKIFDCSFPLDAKENDEYIFSETTQEKIKKLREFLPKNKMNPEEIVDFLIPYFVDNKKTRSCGINYEIGATGNHHCHMVLEDSHGIRFQTIQNMFPSIHIEETQGSKKQALDYLQKKNKFEDKSHTLIVEPKFHGEINGRQGKRTDLDVIEEHLKHGLSPEEIMRKNIKYRKFDTMIKDHYFQQKLENTPDFKENMQVFWHTGNSGSGKTYQQILLKKQFGRENVYVYSDYKNGVDKYQAEHILFMDELKDISYQRLLTILDKYVQQIPARYYNIYSLWTEIHIASIFSPMQLFERIVSEVDRKKDSPEQLFRRISKVIYHYKTVSNIYKQIFFTVEEFNNLKQYNINKIIDYFEKFLPDITQYNYGKDYIR